MIEYVVLEFPRFLYDALGRRTNSRRGWLPDTDAEGVAGAIEAGAVEIGRTPDPAEMEMLLDARDVD